MSTDHERQLLARARELADLADLRDDTLACLGAARHAGLDPDALAGLVGAAAALGATATATYTAGDGWTGTHPSERHFLAHVASIDDDLDEHTAALTRLGRQASAALDAAREDLDDVRGQLTDARRALTAARALPTHDPCDGCHQQQASAVTAAQTAIRTAQETVRECQIRTGICGDITGAVPVLLRRLRHTQARLQSVPADLGETYESVYDLLRRGGTLPYDGRWLTGTGPTG